VSKSKSYQLNIQYDKAKENEILFTKKTNLKDVLRYKKKRKTNKQTIIYYINQIILNKILHKVLWFDQYAPCFYLYTSKQKIERYMIGRFVIFYHI